MNTFEFVEKLGKKGKVFVVIQQDLWHMHSWGVAIELILEPTTKLGFIIVKLD